MKDVKKFIKAKKRKKKIKKIILISTITVIGIVIFLTKAPIFNIREIKFKGNSVLTNESLESMVDYGIGLNIFTLNQKEMKTKLKSNEYISSVDIKIKGVSTIEVSIKEEAPVFYVKEGEKISIINNDMKVIENVDNLDGRRLVEIKGINLKEVFDESRSKELGAYKEILNKFYPYIAENTEELRLDALDISNIVDIKGYIGNVEIFFGDYDDLHNKMENVYSIMLDENLNLKNGYINVSFKGSPVIKKNK